MVRDFSDTQRDVTQRAMKLRFRAAATLVLSIMVVVLFQRLSRATLTAWLHNPAMSWGIAVPVAAVILAWLRRQQLAGAKLHFSRTGITTLLAATALHALAVVTNVDIVDSVAFLMALSGIVLLVWGRGVFRVLYPIVPFLGFMLPLPESVVHAFREPLKTLGATEACWYLQMCGVPAFVHSQDLMIPGGRVQLEQIFTGLEGLMVFLATASAYAIACRRTLSEKLLLVFSGMPAALFVSVAWAVSQTVSLARGPVPETTTLMAPDAWAMIPVTLLILILEIRLLDWIFVEVRDRSPSMSVSTSLPGIVPVKKKKLSV